MDMVTPDEIVRACNETVVRARQAALGWAATPLDARLRVIGAARRLIARDCAALAATLAHRRPVAETLVSEVLPLAEAAAFLRRAAPGLLAPRKLRGGRPLWLWGVAAEVRREPVGVVLVLAPSNYPLFLPGVQILQALAAGNAVCVKPAPGCTAPLQALAALLAEAGLPAGVLSLLDETVAAGEAAVRAGCDRIVLTGSAATGRRVLRAAADTLTPATMELSGNDAVFVLPGADLALVADCLAYGLRLNGGATCIAPRRVFVPATLAGALERALLARIEGIAPAAVPPAVVARLTVLLDEAAAAGARVLARPRPEGVPPIVVADAQPGLRLLQEDVFAPVVSLVLIGGTVQALAAAASCRYALGAAVFGPPAAARALAERVVAGAVVINDVIVPTGDPRLPFGGRGESGFGVTRGAEGLLEMTVVKTISTRRGRFRPHLAPPTHGDARRYTQMIRLLHGGWTGWRAGA
jgi:acyl-CoA reductase-like NAD-dependent aldehyde dehydrogenase